MAVTVAMEHDFKPITPAMQSAMISGDIKAVRRLLDNGASSDMVDKVVNEDLYPPQSFALKTDTLKAVWGRVLEDSDTGFQQSLLIKSIRVRQFNISNLLLARGAKSNVSFMNYDFESTTIKEISAMIVAQMIFNETQEKEAEALVKRMQNNPEGKTFLRVPPSNLPSKLPPQLLIEAVRQGDVFLTQLLLSKGMDVNLLDKDRDTNFQASILMSAISRCHVEVAQILLDKGAQPDLVFLNYDDEEDQLLKSTALLVAIEERDKDPSNTSKAGLVDALQKKIDKTEHSQSSIIIAPNVPEELRPDISPRRIFQPRFSVFTIPEIMIESVDSDNEEDEDLNGINSHRSSSTNHKSTKRKKSDKSSDLESPRKPNQKTFRRNKKQSEVCVIL